LRRTSERARSIVALALAVSTRGLDVLSRVLAIHA